MGWGSCIGTSSPDAQVQAEQSNLAHMKRARDWHQAQPTGVPASALLLFQRGTCAAEAASYSRVRIQSLYLFGTSRSRHLSHPVLAEPLIWAPEQQCPIPTPPRPFPRPSRRHDSPMLGSTYILPPPRSWLVSLFSYSLCPLRLPVLSTPPRIVKRALILRTAENPGQPVEKLSASRASTLEESAPFFGMRSYLLSGYRVCRNGLRASREVRLL